MAVNDTEVQVPSGAEPEYSRQYGALFRRVMQRALGQSQHCVGKRHCARREGDGRYSCWPMNYCQSRRVWHRKLFVLRLNEDCYPNVIIPPHRIYIMLSTLMTSREIVSSITNLKKILKKIYHFLFDKNLLSAP